LQSDKVSDLFEVSEQLEF